MNKATLNEDKNRSIGEKLSSFLPFIVGITIVISFAAVVISLIVNPMSLNSKTNMTIGMIVGTVNTLMTMVATFYFTKKQGSESNKYLNYEH